MTQNHRVKKKEKMYSRYLECVGSNVHTFVLIQPHFHLRLCQMLLFFSPDHSLRFHSRKRSTRPHKSIYIPAVVILIFPPFSSHPHADERSSDFFYSTNTARVSQALQSSPSSPKQSKRMVTKFQT